jgi:DNA modification methylase
MSWRIIYEKSVRYNPQVRRAVKCDDRVIVYEDGSKYHKTNLLNELDNKSWLRFQKSWFILNPKPREKDVILHPAKFPEELVSEFIEFFTKRGQLVLDPMLGTGSTLISCIQTGRSGIGVELLHKYASIAVTRVKKLIKQTVIPTEASYEISIKIIKGDARAIDEMAIPEVDYCITSPPYWDMLTEKGFETQAQRKAQKLDVYYSDNTRDLGAIHSYEDFLTELELIYKKVYDILKPKGYLTIIVKNVKKRDRIYPLAWDIAKRLSKFFVLKDEKIWCQNDIKLAPYGYRYAWVSNTMHHYCLNFRKEA